MLTTGMSIFGKMSVGVRTIARPPKIKIRIATTTNVYGRFSASFTIHINHSQIVSSRHKTESFHNLLLVLRGLVVQGRNQLLGCWRNSYPSGQHNIARRNFPAVHTLVVAIVRTDGRALEGDAGKQATRP